MGIECLDHYTNNHHRLHKHLQAHQPTDIGLRLTKTKKIFSQKKKFVHVFFFLEEKFIIGYGSVSLRKDKFKIIDHEDVHIAPVSAKHKFTRRINAFGQELDLQLYSIDTIFDTEFKYPLL